jgi:hypothetical protein
LRLSLESEHQLKHANRIATAAKINPITLGLSKGIPINTNANKISGTNPKITKYKCAASAAVAGRKISVIRDDCGKYTAFLLRLLCASWGSIPSPIQQASK